MARAPLDLVADTAGKALAAGAGALGAAWQRTKPLHPTGDLRRATITRLGGPVRSGVPWLDEAGTDDVVVRVSRAVGLPEPLPDIHGLAIRLVVDHITADVLLATTGSGRISRYVLLPARRGSRRALTSLLPYRSPRGPLLLAAVPESERSFDLRWAGLVGPWHSFGRLDLGEAWGDDTRLSFDPVRNVLPGLSHYGWVERQREPAYWVARRRTGRDSTPGTDPVSARTPPRRSTD